MAEHTHNWQLIRTVKKNGKTYQFFECINSGCPNPHKMSVS